MGLILNFPLFAIVLLAYNLLAFGVGGDVPLAEIMLFEFSVVSGALVAISIETVVVLMGIVVLFIEIVKATRSTVASVVDHGLSILVFIGFLLEFILVKEVGTAGFLALICLSLLDVIAGFTVTIIGARRDFVRDGV